MAATTIDREPGSDGFYSTKVVSDLSGATERQLDYWDRTGLIQTAIPARGSGSRRRWSKINLEQARALAFFSESVLFESGHDVMSQLASEVASHPNEKITISLQGGLYLVYDPILET